MMASTVRDHQTSTVNDLRALGFSADEITRLTLLKARYPLIEFVETPREWQRLCFLRWRVQYGDLVRPRHPADPKNSSATPSKRRHA
jgi:hypothetical protein